MKILLLGDFSAFHKYLKTGLVRLGHEVVLSADGDGAKKISGADLPLREDIIGSDIISKLKRYFTILKSVKVYKGFDVVHIITPAVFSSSWGAFMVKILKRQNNVLSLANVGQSYATYLEEKKTAQQPAAWEETLYNGKSIKSKIAIKNDKQIVNFVDIIIPGSPIYRRAYGQNHKCYKTIPMPIDLEEFEYHENIVRDKIIFYHGKNRPEKGTDLFEKAFAIITEKYGDKVECHIKDFMPFDEYKKFISRVNVIVDQASEWGGYGMNALIGMAMGKVVMCGKPNEMEDELNITGCPVVPAPCNVDSIVKNMEYIIQNRERIPNWGLESREYVERLHECTKVAAQYMEAWRSTGKILDEENQNMNLRDCLFKPVFGIKHRPFRGSILSGLPFRPKYIYTIQRNGGGASYKSVEQILICIHGDCKILLDTGLEKKVVSLEKTAQGLYVSKGTWLEIQDSSPETVLLVLSSRKMDGADSIKDYDEFLRTVKKSDRSALIKPL